MKVTNRNTQPGVIALIMAGKKVVSTRQISSAWRYRVPDRKRDGGSEKSPR